MSPNQEYPIVGGPGPGATIPPVAALANGNGNNSTGAPLKPAIEVLSRKKKVAGLFVSALGQVISPLEGFDSRDRGEKCSAIPRANGNPSVISVRSREGAVLSEEIRNVCIKCPFNLPVMGCSLATATSSLP